MGPQEEQHIDSDMSLKCLTLCTLLVLLVIEATWAEQSKTLQPRPVQQQRQSKDLKYNHVDLYNHDDEDGDDILEEYGDEHDLNNSDLDELDLQDMDDASIDDLAKLVKELEALETIQPRASARQNTRRRNRNGKGKCGKRNGRRGAAKRRGNKRTRSGPRRRTGAKRVDKV